MVLLSVAVEVDVLTDMLVATEPRRWEFGDDIVVIFDAEGALAEG